MLLVRPPVIGVVVGRSANNAAANLHNWVAGVGLMDRAPLTRAFDAPLVEWTARCADFIRERSAVSDQR